MVVKINISEAYALKIAWNSIGRKRMDLLNKWNTVFLRKNFWKFFYNQLVQVNLTLEFQL